MQEVPAMTHMLQHSVMQQQQQQIQQQPQQQTVLNMTLQVTSEIYWVFCQNHKFPKDFHYRFDKFFDVSTAVFVMSKKRKNNLSKKQSFFFFLFFSTFSQVIHLLMVLANSKAF